ncbi:MAG: class I SAM-dependent methyltransferase [Planctomycetaceae bacterium]|nr:class I SAM-dependent methyltransferase [Planctomycetaceae bacterium]
MASFTAEDWYRTPLYYDIVFAGDEAREAGFLEALVERHAQGAGTGLRRKLRVLEPACGSGRLVAELARRGHSVTGFDLSPQMLAFARERLAEAHLKARLFQARMEDFEAGERYDLAHCLVCTFKYLLDERSARANLKLVARALRPGGLYVIGIHLTQYEDRRRARERWVARRGGTAVTCNIQGWPADPRTRLEDVRSRLRVVERGVVKTSETCWKFRAYDHRQFLRLVRSVPELELAAAYDFGYDIERPRTLPDDQLDTVYVLRRRLGPRARA